MRSDFSWLIIPSIVIGVIVFLSKQTREGEQVQDSVRTINVAQIAFFYEEGRFATSIEELHIGDKLRTDNYDYSIVLNHQAAFNYAIPRSHNLKVYVGGVYLNPFSTNQSINQVDDKPKIPTILCEDNFIGRNKPELPTVDLGVLDCGKGTTKIGS
ncbi:type IV pilin-like G/H family protein [Plectonema cf. radiosum LEGE 06105]|uniref:Type IV pilin-like G/H family protein n=1 Tax=Plectonema cf. radiosum LEGE 06105 TaxID=945769 RepID=A0A8J7JZS9_9CYAN|nr:type IV pilin-like G/H family protein [Plectonema radiosum]MBE9212851.1 type IV pilin-like G/H family protein [Plectonema cf. radiosum LEGE 06105]